MNRLLISMIVLIMVGCGLPFLNYQESSISHEIIQIPEILDRGEKGEFVIQTDRGNECVGAIQYWDAKSETRVIFLPGTVADFEGICTLIWQMPSDFSFDEDMTRASLKIEISNGDDIEYLEPFTFCFSHCP